jgi:hypothetical protein
MLHIQKFLRDGNSIESLTEKFAINSKRHLKYTNLVLFKYDQVKSDFTNDIVRECRGIILDETNDWSIVSRSFDKFFNVQEGNAAKIDWATAKVLEKVDGSLITLFNYKNAWHCSTTGTPDACGPVQDFGFTFAELFWKTFSDTPLPDDTFKCFFFELTSPYNKIVVRHSEPSLTLLGARCMKTQQELTAQQASKFFPNIKLVKEFSLGNINDILATLEHMPLTQEGYVIVDKDFNRIKAKSPAYTAAHHLLDSLGSSRRALVEVVLKGEIDEVIAVLPEFKDDLLEMRSRLDAIVYDLEKSYEEIKDISLQKDFAKIAVLSRCPGALFAVRAKKEYAKDFISYIRSLHIDSAVSLLGYKTSGK